MTRVWALDRLKPTIRAPTPDKEAQQEHLFEEFWKGLSESEIEVLDDCADGRFVMTDFFVYLHTVCNWLTCVPGASAAL